MQNTTEKSRGGLSQTDHVIFATGLYESLSVNSLQRVFISVLNFIHPQHEKITPLIYFERTYIDIRTFLFVSSLCVLFLCSLFVFCCVRSFVVIGSKYFDAASGSRSV